MSETLELLFTLDEGYIPPLKVALKSIYENNVKENFRIWLVHEHISKEKLMEVQALTDSFHWEFQNVQVDGSRFSDAPTQERYPKEMYFRLLAGEILPQELKKVLYLDPDILVINPLRPLWEKEISDYLLTASTHIGVVDVTTAVNNLRLDTDHGYYNSGIMLMNLTKAREIIKWEDILKTLEKYGHYLMLPDQDILNHLYGKYILEVPDEIWNYDARNYGTYFIRSLGKMDIQWVMKNTSILHFNGKPKPWSPKHDNRFTALYLNYQNLLETRN